MRELVLKMSMTLDGFVCGPAGEADWIFGTDPAAKAWVLETVWNASLHIMGSRSFQDMAGYWPMSTTPFAAPMNQIPKAVFSKKGPAVLKAASTPVEQQQAGARSWAEAYVASGDLTDEVAQLKAGEGKPILAHGGARFARSLVARNLVDEYALVVHPIVLGQGLSIFSGLPASRPLKLVSSKAFPGGAMAMVYRSQ